MFGPLVPWGVKAFHRETSASTESPAFAERHDDRRKERGKKTKRKSTSGKEELLFHCIFPWSSSLTLICPV